VEQERELLRVVAQDQALAEPPSDAEGDGEEGRRGGDVDAHLRPAGIRRAMRGQIAGRVGHGVRDGPVIS
jgi:hypothetical protein